MGWAFKIPGLPHYVRNDVRVSLFFYERDIILNKIMATLKNIIAPSFCSSCKIFIETDFLCATCLALITPITTIKIPLTKKYQASLFAISDYQEPLRTLLLKKGHRNRLASEQLGNLLWQHSDVRYADFDIIVPVPLHWTKYAWRWFNQSEEIAHIMSKKSGKPVVHLLTRKRITATQAGLTRAKRLLNLQDAFVLSDNSQFYKYKKILLIDDVMTTGTTLQSCFKQLIKLSPLNLYGSVICRRL
ncbi:hypothetical protein K9K77_02000 [Candidatus Babeliales bacterium]|nr:hypothetical protein [Candidatus Babeliales bacterium]